MSDNAELARRSEIVIVSVRPEQFGGLTLNLQGKLAISVMAGVSMATLQRKLNSDRLVRTMPNAAAEIGRSYTPWVVSERVSGADRAFVTALFSSCGDEDEVESERQLDYLTGSADRDRLSLLCWPRRCCSMRRKSGIPERVAMRAVRGVICGATPLMDNDSFNPTETVETFVAYRGTTAAGLSAMAKAGLPDAVSSGLAAAAAAGVTMAAKYDV